VALWLVSSYGGLLVATVMATYGVAAVVGDEDVLPLLCEAGSESPAYLVFAGGMSASAALFMWIVWEAFRQIHGMCTGAEQLAFNLIALVCGIAAGIALVLMATLSIRGEYRRRHNDAAKVYLFGSLLHAVFITVLSCMVKTALYLRIWRCVVTGAALACVFLMWYLRRMYVKLLRRQQPMYKNLFNGLPVSRDISDDGDLMNELEYGQMDSPVMPIASETNAHVQGEAIASEGNQELTIKRWWAGIQVLSIICLVAFVASLAM